MRRPFPSTPRGRGIRRKPPERLILGCPKICPEWQLAAIRALIKPQYKEAIKHRSPKQKWSRSSKKTVATAAQAVHDRLGVALLLHFPDGGDYHFVVEVDAGDLEGAKGLAVLASKRLEGIWLTLGRWYIRDGKFYRKQRSYNILLRPASNVHLNRETWSALRGELAGVS